MNDPVAIRVETEYLHGSSCKLFIGRKKASDSKIPYKIVKHSIGLGGGLTNDSKTGGSQK